MSPFPVVTFLAPGLNTTDFLTPGIPTRAIAFDSSDNLYIEDTSDDNSGTINVLQLTAASGYTGSISYASYPATHNSTTYKAATGLACDGLGCLYVAERTILIDGRVATGIAVDASGDIFISNPEQTYLQLLGNSIYRFAANDLLSPELIATFDTRGGELTFGAAGNLYMVAGDQRNIIKLSRAVVRAMPCLPLLLE